MTDFLRKVDAENPKKENPYEKFGFTRNPFPSKTSINIGDLDPRNNGSIYVEDLREKEQVQFNRIIIPSNTTPEPKPIAFLMDYATRKGRGIGKTAFLNYQRQLIQRDLGDKQSDGTEVILAVYVSPRPDEAYKKFHSISKLIIESIIDQDLIAMVATRLMAFTGQINETVLNEGLKSPTDAFNTIGNQSWLIDQHVKREKEFDYHRLTQSVRSMLNGLNISADLVNCISRFGTDSEDFKKFYFNKQTEVFWKANANNILFNDLVKVFKAAGITKTIILFDELEKVVPKQNAAERRDFCDILRYYFVDGDSQNCVDTFYHILFTIHPYLQEILVPHWEASGLQRFAALGGDLAYDYTVYFEPLDESTAIPLARAYMDAARINHEEDGELTPFTDNALREALNITIGLPGKYLNLLNSSVNRAVELNWEKIDVEEIKEVEMPIIPKEEPPEHDDPLPDPKVKL